MLASHVPTVTPYQKHFSESPQGGYHLMRTVTSRLLTMRTLLLSSASSESSSTKSSMTATVRVRKLTLQSFRRLNHTAMRSVFSMARPAPIMTASWPALSPSAEGCGWTARAAILALRGRPCVDDPSSPPPPSSCLLARRITDLNDALVDTLMILEDLVPICRPSIGRRR